MSSKDVSYLRYDACFSKLVSPGVYWVPVREMGDSRFSTDELCAFRSSHPHEKRNAVSTLYEAIQQFSCCGFTESSDTIKIQENGILWEHHKPGYYSVLTNTGCCSSAASWLAYILENRYDEIGMLSFIRPSGGGHVINYIRHDGWIYFVDMMAHTKDYATKGVPETGQAKDIIKSKIVTSMCVKARSFEEYARFYRRYLQYKGSEYFFTKQALDVCCPISADRRGNMLVIILPRGIEIELISFEYASHQFGYRFAEAPQKIPDWSICT